MADVSKLRVLFFDVFGTCVVQPKAVADELGDAATRALEEGDSEISEDVRRRAGEMGHEEWFDFANKWNAANVKFVQENIAKHDSVDWKAVDEQRIALLPKMLAERGLLHLDEDHSGKIKPGSLFTSSQLSHLGRIWHRLPTWPDTNRGLDLLNKHFATAALSNTYAALLASLVKHSAIPFTHLFSADVFDSFKPSPKVYLGAAEKLGVKPEECALVAAHLGDLKAAKACGFYAIYVERPWEEKQPELRGEGIPDLVIGEDDEGFVALAERLKQTR